MTDEQYTEPIPFANVVVFSMDGNQIGVGTTNMDGMVSISVPVSNKYLVRGVFVGYKAVTDTIEMGNKNVKFHQLKLSEYAGMISCCMCCCFSSEEIETEEEVWEAERMIERAEEEMEIRNDLNDFICYPNPTSDYVNINVNGLEATELLILNTSGQQIIKREINDELYSFEFNLNHLPSGLYLVVCRGSGLSSKTKTICKQ